MGSVKPLWDLVDFVIALLEEQRDVAVAGARAAVGTMFCLSGYGKLGDLDHFVEVFRGLGIPAPELQAPFVASLECFGGALLVLGLGTRLFSALLGSTMVVAILTERLEAARVDSLLDFLYLNEWLLLVILAWLVFTGGGRLSLDYRIGPAIRAKLGG